MFLLTTTTMLYNGFPDLTHANIRFTQAINLAAITNYQKP
jgi:hypothetical protein